MATRGRPTRVLVTGGTGFVGSHTVAQLTMHGYGVRLLVRDPAKINAVPALSGTTDLKVVVGDVTDLDAVRRSLDGCTAVVHAAARVSLAGREADDVYATNVVRWLAASGYVDARLAGTLAH
jgi:dihydroflavonol-4-reductase